MIVEIVWFAFGIISEKYFFHSNFNFFSLKELENHTSLPLRMLQAYMLPSPEPAN